MVGFGGSWLDAIKAAEDARPGGAFPWQNPSYNPLDPAQREPLPWPVRVLEGGTDRLCELFRTQGAIGEALSIGALLHDRCFGRIPAGEMPQYREDGLCSILRLTYRDIDVAAPGQPEQGDFTADVQRGYEIKQSDGAFAGFAGGCIYAENPDGSTVPLSCTNFPEFSNDLNIVSLSAACAPESPVSDPVPRYEPVTPDAPPPRNFDFDPGNGPVVNIDLPDLTVPIDLPDFNICIDGLCVPIANPVPDKCCEQCATELDKGALSAEFSGKFTINYAKPNNGVIVAVGYIVTQKSPGNGLIVGTSPNILNTGRLGVVSLEGESLAGDLYVSGHQSLSSDKAIIGFPVMGANIVAAHFSLLPDWSIRVYSVIKIDSSL